MGAQALDLGWMMSGGFGSSGSECVYGTDGCTDGANAVDGRAESVLDSESTITPNEAAGLECTDEVEFSWVTRG